MHIFRIKEHKKWNQKNELIIITLHLASSPFCSWGHCQDPKSNSFNLSKTNSSSIDSDYSQSTQQPEFRLQKSERKGERALLIKDKDWTESERTPSVSSAQLSCMIKGPWEYGRVRPDMASFQQAGEVQEYLAIFPQQKQNTSSLLGKISEALSF